MSIDRISGAVKRRGNANGTARLSSSTGSFTGDLISLPIIKESTFTDNTAIEYENDETQDRYAQQGTREVSLELTLMQSDQDTLDLASVTYRDNYFMIVKQITKTAVLHDDDSYYHIFQLYPIAKLRPSFEESLPGIDVPMAFDLEKATSLITVDVSDFDDSAFDVALTGNITVGTGEYYKRFKIASS